MCGRMLRCGSTTWRSVQFRPWRRKHRRQATLHRASSEDVDSGRLLSCTLTMFHLDILGIQARRPPTKVHQMRKYLVAVAVGAMLIASQAAADENAVVGVGDQVG